MTASTAIAFLISLATMVSMYLAGLFESHPTIVLVLAGVAKFIIALLGPLFAPKDAPATKPQL